MTSEADLSAFIASVPEWILRIVLESCSQTKPTPKLRLVCDEENTEEVP